MTTTNRRMILLLSGIALALSACGADPKAANEINFKNSLNAHFTKMKEFFSLGSEPGDDGVIFSHRTDGRGLAAKKQALFQALVSEDVLETVCLKRRTNI